MEITFPISLAISKTEKQEIKRKKTKNIPNLATVALLYSLTLTEFTNPSISFFLSLSLSLSLSLKLTRKWLLEESYPLFSDRPHGDPPDRRSQALPLDSPLRRRHHALLHTAISCRAWPITRLPLLRRRLQLRLLRRRRREARSPMSSPVLDRLGRCARSLEPSWMLGSRKGCLRSWPR